MAARILVELKDQQAARSGQLLFWARGTLALVPHQVCTLGGLRVIVIRLRLSFREAALRLYGQTSKLMLLPLRARLDVVEYMACHARGRREMIRPGPRSAAYANASNIIVASQAELGPGMQHRPFCMHMFSA